MPEEPKLGRADRFFLSSPSGLTVDVSGATGPDLFPAIDRDKVKLAAKMAGSAARRAGGAAAKSGGAAGKAPARVTYPVASAAKRNPKKAIAAGVAVAVAAGVAIAKSRKKATGSVKARPSNRPSNKPKA